MSLYLDNIVYYSESNKMDNKTVNSILNYWYDTNGNYDLWFNATPEDDTYIKITFGHLVCNATMELLQPNLINIYSNKQILAQIIVFDQFVRHIYRNNRDEMPKIYSEYALDMSMYFIQTKRDNDLLPQERTFMLMPIRHTFDEYYLSIVIKKMQQYMRSDEKSTVYKRFMNATLRAYSRIITPKITPVSILSNDTNFSDVLEILDKTHPSPTNLVNITLFNDKKDKIYNAFRNAIQHLNNPETVTISLSGGIDSMISSYILQQLSNGGTRFKVQAIMMNYGNRKECATEVKFVTRWCNMLQIPLYVRHITEMSRDVDTRHKYRDLYEEVTRFFRFSAYKCMNSPIFLGHNQDDCEENIITNIRKQRSNDNLRGMTMFGIEDECLIVRPMLNISKEEIFAFSDKYQIPYLVNSTPSWCDRGKMREILIPFLNEFDPAFIPGLLKMSDHFRELYQIYDQSVVQSFSKDIIVNEEQYFIPLTVESKERLYGYIFWKDVIIDFCKTINVGFPSSKSIVTLIKRLSKNSYGNIDLTKDISIQFNKTGLIYNKD